MSDILRPLQRVEDELPRVAQELYDLDLQNVDPKIVTAIRSTAQAIELAQKTVHRVVWLLEHWRDFRLFVSAGAQLKQATMEQLLARVDKIEELFTR